MNTEARGIRNIRNKILLFILIIFTAFSCSTQRYNRVNCSDVKKIRIAYLEQMLEVSIPINECGDVFRHYDVMRFAEITDSVFIRQFVKEINKLKVSKDLKDSISYDLRIYCTIGNAHTTLCLGGFWGTLFNGQLMEDNRKIFRMLEKLLYAEDIKKYKEDSKKWKKDNPRWKEDRKEWREKQKKLEEERRKWGY
jgi:hypothetical protein